MAAQAAQPPVGLFQLDHTAVMPEGESVGEVLHIVQDKTGFLWLSTFDGRLLRFDGQQVVEPYHSQLKAYQTPVTILLAPDGSSRDMWIGHRRQGVTHLVDGRATHYEGGALPQGSVFVLIRDTHGVIWATTPQGVARFVDGRWQPLPASMGWAHPHPEQLVMEKATGDIYVADAEQGTLISRGGVAPFVQVPRREYDRVNAGLPKGAAWTLPPDQDGPALFASDGGFWHGPEHGVDRYRWSSGQPAGGPDIKENIDIGQGLSSSLVFDIMEDREGDIWLGTRKGLDRFRRLHFTPMLFPKQLSSPVLTLATDGVMWVSNSSEAPYRLINGRPEPVDGLKIGASAVLAERDGGMLFAGRNGVRRWRNGKIDFLPVPEPLSRVGTRFHDLQDDGAGGFWVIAQTFGLYHVTQGNWQRMNGKDGLPQDIPVLLAALPDGGVGIAYAGQGLYIVRHGQVSRVAGSEANRLTTPVSWVASGASSWIGGSGGLFRLENGRTSVYTRRDGTPFTDVSGLAFDRQGALWLFDRDGIDRIDAGELSAAPNGGPVDTVHIDRTEGIGENQAGVRGASTMLVDTAGVVWAAGDDTVSTLAPGTVPQNTVRPQVSVQSVALDQVMQSSIADLHVPPARHSIRIDYTAPMLRRPEHGRFEYRLSGVDDAWQQAGTRRSAYYTNLSPGQYEFRVRAFNEDGFQSASDAVYRFCVTPAWYQTWMFWIAVSVVFLFLVWLGYVARMRAVTRHLRIRIDERERIARALHDTLLQSCQGLVLRFHAIRKLVTQEEPRRMIDRALARADAVIVEARETVSTLRLTEDVRDPSDLVLSLENIGQEQSDISPVAYRVIVAGTPRLLRHEVNENVLAIAREAVANAMKHASATTIDVQVSFGRRRFDMQVRDNGTGMVDPDRPGHWGLLGMHERARDVDGELSITSTPGHGTTVALELNASDAYV